MAVYFTADMHFNHAGVIYFDKRPFSDVEEMNRSMVEYLNIKDPFEQVYFGDNGWLRTGKKIIGNKSYMFR